MISLLLTLFISLFSCCPSINRLEDHHENNIVDVCSLPKKAFESNGWTYVAYSDFVNPSFIKNCLHNMLNFEGTFLSTGVSADDFLHGTPVTFNVSNTPSISDIVKLYNYNENTNTMDIYGGYLQVTSLTFYFFNDRDTYKYFNVNFTMHNLNNNTDTIYYFDNTLYVAKDSWSGTMYQSTGDGFNTTMRYKYISGLALNFPWLPKTGWDTLGFQQASSSGYQEGYNAGSQYGFQYGYGLGYDDAFNTDATASTIFTGILDVALIPVNVFLTIFNFEVFGINIGGIVSGLLTLSVVIIIFRFLFGGNKDD